jgi:AcrR family transcriptional regulator
MPRPYDLGRRAAPKAETRARIVAAALEVFREQGYSGASNLAIAKAADVAPATVRNHFPEPEGLARAVFDALLADLRVPTPAVFDGATGLHDRVERLARELAAFYERSAPWWRLYEREPELITVWGGGVDAYYADVDGLIRAALGELAPDERSVAVLAAVVGPPTFFALKARGHGSDAAVELTLELVLPWLERRVGELTNSGMTAPSQTRSKAQT